jgi:hypothetical protein
MNAEIAEAESLFGNSNRREAELNTALEQERARREAAIKNMNRLRLLRLERDAKKRAVDGGNDDE